MRRSKWEAGLTVVEMVAAMAIISMLGAIHFFMVEGYKDRRMSELAAKVLTQAARAEEEFFTREHRYFDADVQGNGGEEFLTVPGGGKTNVRIPPNIILSLKAQGKDKREFIGYAFFTKSRVLHRYESKTGKMTAGERVQGGSR